MIKNLKSKKLRSSLLAYTLFCSQNLVFICRKSAIYKTLAHPPFVFCFIIRNKEIHQRFIILFKALSSAYFMSITFHVLEVFKFHLKKATIACCNCSLKPFIFLVVLIFEKNFFSKGISKTNSLSKLYLFCHLFFCFRVDFTGSFSLLKIKFTVHNYV
jgi:hypothetical protein